MKIAASHLHAYAAAKGNYDTHEDYLEGELEAILTSDEWSNLQAWDLRVVIADFSMSENHPGGDDILDYIDDTLKVVAAGYTVYTWYGPQAETLVVGYRPGELEIVDDYPATKDLPSGG